MKLFWMAAIAAFFATPVMAQGWGGTPTTGTITGASSGVDWNASTWFGTSTAHTTPLSIRCFKGTFPQYTLPPCAPGERLTYTNVIADAGGNNVAVPSVALTSLPALAAAADSQVGIGIAGAYKDPAAPGGISYMQGSIPLSQFAQASAVDADIAATNSRLDALSIRIDQSQRVAFQGVALAASLNLAPPSSGKQNRLAFGVGTFARQSAVSVNYTRQAGTFDFGIAAAFADGQALGKAGMGFNW